MEKEIEDIGMKKLNNPDRFNGTWLHVVLTCYAPL